MTPEPLQTCTSHSVLEGYLAGAAHLRHWIDASQGDVHRALMGYAGGYRFIANCARGPRLRSTGIHDDLCRVADIELAVAARIKRLRDRGHTV